MSRVMSRIDHTTDGPVTPFVLISRAVNKVANGYSPEDMANDLYKALSERGWLNKGFEPSQEEPTNHISTSLLDEAREEGIKKAKYILTSVAFDEDEVDANNLADVDIIFEALGTLIRWEEYGHKVMYKFPKRVSIETMSKLCGTYLDEVQGFHCNELLITDDNESGERFCVVRGDQIRSSMLIILREFLERNVDGSKVDNYPQLLDAIRNWEKNVAECIPYRYLNSFLFERPREGRYYYE